jgi:hypothetical protein
MNSNEPNSNTITQRSRLKDRLRRVEGLHAKKNVDKESSATAREKRKYTKDKEGWSRRWLVRNRNDQQLPQVSQPMEPKLPQDEHLGKQELPHVRHSTTSVKNLGG